jgi:hypothetical protein
MMDSPRLSALQLLLLLTLVLAAMPSGAHLFEMANKMTLPPSEYITVQKIYRGWALFGVVILAALALALVHAYIARRNAAALGWSLLGFLAIAATQVIFWAWTYPLNVETHDWTVMPPDFEAARRQWEYSHAVSAAIMLAAFAFMTLAVLATRRPGKSAS